MGNVAEAGKCCTIASGNDARCCAPAGSNKPIVGDDAEALGSPVPAHGQSSELAGVRPAAAPGFSAQEEFEMQGDKSPTAGAGQTPMGEHNNLALGTEDGIGGCPGGDSAAGGEGLRMDKDSKTTTYPDGSTYTGQIVDDKRHGHGLWQSRNGWYNGQWLNDMQHGQGRQTWSDGRAYEGQFHAGKFAGKGQMIWHTQKGMLIYDGQYKDDLKHGTGKFIWADGRMYDGEWKCGKRHGKGKYMNNKQEQKFGFWVDDKFERWDSQNETEN